MPKVYRARILVVDDEPQIRAMLGTLLRQNGYQVTEAEDGEAALKVAGAANVDVIILDLARVGGVTPWRKVAEIANHPEAGPRADHHCSYLSLR